MLSGFSFMVLVAITLVCNLAFCWMTSEMSKASLGRGLKWSSWVIWVIVPTLIQIILIDRLFHPVTYLILMAGVLVMILLTVNKVPEAEDEAKNDLTETPYTRLGSWLLFAIPIEAAMIFSSALVADLMPGTFWALNRNGTVGRNLALLLTPFVLMALIGLIKAIAVSRDAEDKSENETTMATDDLEDIPDEAAMAS